MFKKIYFVFVAAFFLIAGCEQEKGHSTQKDGSQICVYEMMMLKGNVKEVREEQEVVKINSDAPAISSCLFRFDKAGNPQKIIITSPTTQTTITRSYKYR